MGRPCVKTRHSVIIHSYLPCCLCVHVCLSDIQLQLRWCQPETSGAVDSFHTVHKTGCWMRVAAVCWQAAHLSNAGQCIPPSLPRLALSCLVLLGAGRHTAEIWSICVDVSCVLFVVVGWLLLTCTVVSLLGLANLRSHPTFARPTVTIPRLWCLHQICRVCRR